MNYSPKITVDHRDYCIDDMFGLISKTVAIFEDKDSRMLPNHFDSLGSYNRKEIAIYTTLAKMLNDKDPDTAKPHLELIDELFETITRTPMIISRKNAGSIVSTLANIGVISIALGKVNQFILFMHSVLQDHLYVSESSLEDHYGSSYIKEKKFVLPNYDERYKNAYPLKENIVNILETIKNRISDTYFTYLFADLLKDSKAYLDFQISMGVDIQRMFIYKCDGLSNLAEIATYIAKKRDLSVGRTIVAMTDNDSLASTNGTVGLTKADAVLFNLVTPEYVSYLCYFPIVDADFIFAVERSVPMNRFYIRKDVLDKHGKDLFYKIVSANIQLPKNMLNPSYIVDAGIEPPVEYFVKNIGMLYADAPHALREYFNTKFSLQTITNLLH